LATRTFFIIETDDNFIADLAKEFFRLRMFFKQINRSFVKSNLTNEFRKSTFFLLFTEKHHSNSGFAGRLFDLISTFNA